MENELDKVKTELKEVKESFNAWEFAYNILDKNAKRERFINKLFFAIIILLLFINAYFAYVFTTTNVVETTETTTNQEGVYNFYDSEGNMVSSDLSLDEMKELIEVNEDGKDNNQEKDN